MREKLIYALAAAGGLWLVRNLYVILLRLPDEVEQGAIYRIMFFHIPSWFVCFTAFFVAGAASAVYLARRRAGIDALAVSAVEVGVAFTAVGLVTGAIWARIIWGIWWTWDPRLTWALICLLVYLGYLMLRRAIDDPTERAKNSAVLCIFAFTSVVITYKAIDWWRTQHPGAVLSFRTGGGNIDPFMETMLYQNWLAWLLLAAAFVMIRMRQEETQREIDALRRMAHAL
ncbi:MAG: cytochrome c biogenesis protein CcsA [Bryobacteraceae bacterium]|nr:cytochrome c biogenesis protein CcsA [Bryobacteraceae bacterium]